MNPSATRSIDARSGSRSVRPGSIVSDPRRYGNDQIRSFTIMTLSFILFSIHNHSSSVTGKSLKLVDLVVDVHPIRRQTRTEIS